MSQNYIALNWICCDSVELENSLARLVEPEELVKWFHGTKKKKKQSVCGFNKSPTVLQLSVLKACSHCLHNFCFSESMDSCFQVDLIHPIPLRSFQTGRAVKVFHLTQKHEMSLLKWRRSILEGITVKTQRFLELWLHKLSIKHEKKMFLQ